MVWRGSSKTTARIELKRRMADGGCQNWVEAADGDGGCQTAVLVVVNISAVVLHPPLLNVASTQRALTPAVRQIISGNGKAET